MYRHNGKHFWTFTFRFLTVTLISIFLSINVVTKKIYIINHMSLPGHKKGLIEIQIFFTFVFHTYK